MSSMDNACFSDTIVKEWKEADCNTSASGPDAVNVVCHMPNFNISDGKMHRYESKRDSMDRVCDGF